MNETDRPHRALEELAKLWTERAYEARSLRRSPRYEGYALAMMEAAEELRTALAPEQRGDAEPQEGTLEARLRDEPKEDHLPDGSLRCVKCWREPCCCGVSTAYRDASEALRKEAADALAALAPPQEGELLEERYWCGCTRFARWERCEHHPDLDHDEEPMTRAEEDAYVERAAPTPDREAHKKLYSVLIAYAENRLTLGEAADRILATLAAPPPREPDWLREYEWRKLALIEAATICGRNGSGPEQDTAERALDEWVLAALPGGREREEEIRASVYEDAALIAEECATGKRAAKELRTAAEGARTLAAAPQASADTGEP
jgi:hypothetical protein